MKLSIRDLFWLLLVLAVLFAWEADHRSMSAENKALIDTLNQNGVSYLVK